jgi:23S rRNA (cytosine1962-C5)-methyltransferase
MSIRYTQAAIDRQAAMLANRVEKNLKHLRRFFAKSNTNCFRVYDWDIPEIRATVDWYDGSLYMCEYERLQTQGTDWLEQMARAVAGKLGLNDNSIHLRRRRTRPSSGRRYKKLNQLGLQKQVRENGLSFLVNLDDYQDTGIFLDHRNTRQMVREMASGLDVLNLYAYTGSFSVYASAGDARLVTSVDASSRYLDWARGNLELNSLSANHQFEQGDCFEYLKNSRRNSMSWDLIICDPPSFSDFSGNDFDVLRDQSELVQQCLDVLRPGGTLLFSTNHQRFEANFETLGGFDSVREISQQTIPCDFRRTPHRCFQFKR